MAAKHVQARRLERLYIEGAQGWNDGREAVKRQAYRVFNETRVVEKDENEQERSSCLYI